MQQHPRQIVAEWIEDQRRAGNTDALRWLIQEAALALLASYPERTGREVLWGLFRTIAGPEEGEIS